MDDENEGDYEFSRPLLGSELHLSLEKILENKPVQTVADFSTILMGHITTVDARNGMKILSLLQQMTSQCQRIVRENIIEIDGLAVELGLKEDKG